MVAASRVDAENCRNLLPRLLGHTLLTPVTPIKVGRGFVIRSYIWTPRARGLPAEARMALRAGLSPFIDEDSEEEEFPFNLLSW